VLTRAHGLDAAARDAVAARVRAVGPAGLPVFFADHAARDLWVRPEGASRPVAALQGQKVALLSAIARPESFARTVQRLGAEVVFDERRRDHHRFAAEDQQRVAERALADDEEGVGGNARDQQRQPDREGALGERGATERCAEGGHDAVRLAVGPVVSLDAGIDADAVAQ